MTHSDFGQAFIFTGDAREEYLFGMGLNKRIYRSGPISFEIEVDWFRHAASQQSGGRYQSQPYASTSAQNFGEGVLALGARVWLRPWINIGIFEGVSYNSSPSNYERTNREKNSQILNYLGAEVEALVSDRFSLVGRIHHRSGAFGTFGGVKGGSNAYLIGFRYRWGSTNKKEQLTPIPPPIGCSGSELLNKTFPRSLEERLEVFGISKLMPLPKSQKVNPFVIRNQTQDKNWVSKSNSSKLSYAQQEALRKRLIRLIDQKIHKIEYRDSFGLQGKLGIKGASNTTEEQNQPVSLKIPQLSPKASSQLVSGYITRWRLQAAKIKLNPEGWKADRISFTNDPFTPTQTRIEAHNVVAKEENNGDILITSSRSRLIVEERIEIPLVKSTRIKRSESVRNRWVVGIDQGDRDGFYVGRSLDPIQLGENYKLSLQPQFLLQRAIKNQTDSYIAPGSSVTSKNVRASTTGADLFGMKGKIRGTSYGFDVNLDANISTFNSERLLNGSRYWGSLRRSAKVPLFEEVNTTLFATYRYKVWNGSIGEKDIYTAYGGFAEKSYDWNWGMLKNTYLVRYGLGNYQAESLDGGSLSELWRTNLYTSLLSQYPIWQNSNLLYPYEKNYRYSPIPINPGLTFDTNLSTAHFLYQDGKSQNVISFTGGPTLTLGTFTKPFLDYTKISIFSGGSLKEGGSPFAFDEVVDLATLGLGLTQQIAGPLLLNTGFEINIDGGSDYYGKTIDSNIELRWQRRSYDLGIFYNPARGVGGISFHLNDFNFKGTGIPFTPYSPSQYKDKIGSLAL